MRRNGKTFIDSNILIYGESFQKADVFCWIHNMYESIYIHKTVLDELITGKAREKVTDLIDKDNHWILFDPDDEQTLSDEMYDLYESFVKDIREAFHQLDEKKREEGRPLKNTNDLGEIHSLAAAMLFSANIICSNDVDIREVIEDSQLSITLEEDEESLLIEQDTLEDFCYYAIVLGIDKPSLIRKFFKTVHPDRIDMLDNRLKSNKK